MLLAALSSMAAACSVAQQRAESDDAAFALQRTACFGDCPVYSVAVEAEGHVICIGSEHTRELGVRTSRIEPQVRRRIVEALRVLASMQNSYEFEKDGCGRTWTDQPSVMLSVHSSRMDKHVVLYYGCQGGRVADDTRKIDALAREIDEAVASQRWTGLAHPPTLADLPQ
ncbi:MAG TPA: DUF6438 domain-containing protein [Dokdonella sp.]